MEISTFKIEGMTCQSCVDKITQELKSIPTVDSVQVSLADKSVKLQSAGTIDIATVKKALSFMPKYSVYNGTDKNVLQNKVVTESKLKTYKPLIIVFTYVFLVSLSVQIYNEVFQAHQFMNHIMAGFFIGLSFFKFLNLQSFADSFANYDPIAQKFLPYGRIYPFIELIAGLSFVSGIGLIYANITTIIILSLTTAGVVKMLNSKRQFQCACLGAGFNLPLSWVTVFENIVMIFMATYGIKIYIFNS